LYARYLKDPQSVTADWVIHFESLNDGLVRTVGHEEAATAALVEVFPSYGHKEAQLDPVGLAPEVHALEIDHAKDTVGFARFKLSVGDRSTDVTKDEGEEILRQPYCGHVALEAGHLDAIDDRAWLHELFEKEVLTEPDELVLTSAMESVLLADELERFTGLDVIIVRGDKIAALYVFLDSIPSRPGPRPRRRELNPGRDNGPGGDIAGEARLTSLGFGCAALN
jgi:2-oxoglutarate dehydrogenase E1 component